MVNAKKEVKNFTQFRYDGEIQRAEEAMVMISDCNRNPRMESVMKSMREAFSSSEGKKGEWTHFA